MIYFYWLGPTEFETIIKGGTKEFEGVTGKIITKRINDKQNSEHLHTLYLKW